MQVFCPKCHIEIETVDINIGTDIAMCRKCKDLYSLSNLFNTKKTIESQPPKGSRIIFQENLNKEIEITYPKQGFSMQLILPIFILIFGFVFMANWTINASKASILFAMFSLPAWIFGIVGVIGILNAIYEVKKIFVDRKSLIYKCNRIIFSKKIEIPLQEIIAVNLKSLNDKSPSISVFLNGMRKDEELNEIIHLAPAIISGRKTIYFFENTNDAEKEWITLYLNDLIHTRK